MSDEIIFSDRVGKLEGLMEGVLKRLDVIEQDIRRIDQKIWIVIVGILLLLIKEPLLSFLKSL